MNSLNCLTESHDGLCHRTTLPVLDGQIYAGYYPVEVKETYKTTLYGWGDLSGEAVVVVPEGTAWKLILRPEDAAALGIEVQ